MPTIAVNLKDAAGGDQFCFCTEDWSPARRGGEKLKWGEGMEPRFISWIAAALHTLDFTFPDIWSRKKIKAIPSRKPEVSAGH